MGNSFMLMVIWCFTQPLPYCMTMNVPNLTEDQCEQIKPIALNRAMTLGAIKPDATCKEFKPPGIPTRYSLRKS